MKPPIPQGAIDAYNATTHLSGTEQLQAVWDALLNEGEVRYIVGRRAQVDTLYDTWERADDFEPDGRINRVLVVPVGRDPQTPHVEEGA